MWRIKRRSASSSRTKAALVALLLIVVGFSLVRGYLDLRASRRLAAEGVATMAQVVGKHIRRSPGLHGGTHAYYLDVEYRTQAGQVLAQSDRVSESQYKRANPGDLLLAHYLPSDPTFHALGARVQPEYFWLLMSLVFSLITAVYCIFGREKSSRR
jgi:hypothetical protein